MIFFRTNGKIADWSLTGEGFRFGDNKFMTAASKFLDETFGEVGAIFRMILMTAGITFDVLDSVVYTALRVAFKLIGSALAVFDWLNWPMVIVALVGNVWDTIDPCKLKDEMSVFVLRDLNTQFDQVVRNSVFGNMNSAYTPQGVPLLTLKWPLHYYADSLAQSLTSDPKSSWALSDQKKKMEYRALYLLGLSKNSDGLTIYYPPDSCLPSNLVSDGILQWDRLFQNIGESLGVQFGDSNTVFENWITKWWPLLIFIIIVVLIVFNCSNKMSNQESCPDSSQCGIEGCGLPTAQDLFAAEQYATQMMAKDRCQEAAKILKDDNAPGCKDGDCLKWFEDTAQYYPWKQWITDFQETDIYSRDTKKEP